MMEARISGTTKLLGLIGSPVSHSGSPAMHNYACALKGLDYAYLAFDVAKEDAGKAIEAMKTFHMAGCNVTMPCKQAVLPYMDQLSPAAELMGAVNTIVNCDGKLIGYNTDGEGFVRNLLDHGVDVRGKKLTICGGGGAATAIQIQCALDGARELSIFNRTLARVEETAEKIRARVPGIVIHTFEFSDQASFAREIADSDILINGTSLGMKPLEDQSIVEDPSLLRPELTVCDVVYNPLETKLLQQAGERGCKTVNGKGMLLWQGVSAFKLFTGQDMPVEEVKAKYFSPRENLFLIGFMGSGKSTIASRLATEKNMKLVEMDARIEQEAGITINEIFEKYGEEYFRNLETELVKTIGKEGNTVVSCGGGTAMRQANVEAMKASGRICYLSAEPGTIYERVKNSTNRPLLKGHMNVEYIGELLEKRRPKYEAAADFTVTTDHKGREAICKEISLLLERKNG